MSWEDNVRKVVPYVPGEQPQNKVIKINTNECPYPPAPGVVRAMKELDPDLLRRYPDPQCSLLVNALADYYHLRPEQVFVGVGSDDVLSICFLTFFYGNRPILFPDITYSFYDVWADLYRIPYKTCDLDEDFFIKKEDYFVENGGIILANPNAPTGVAMEISQIEEIVRKNQDVVVIIDEAYIDFGGVSALSLIDKYDNLLVVQTFSKSRALAGLRVGYAMGSAKLIKYMNDVKFSVNSYTMNQAAIYYGVEAVADDAYFKEIVARTIETREWTKTELKKLGFSFADSQTNFIFATHKEASAKMIFEKLKEKGIFVRYFKQPKIEKYLRISIGTPEQMQVVIESLKEILG